MNRVMQTPRSKLVFIVPECTEANTIDFSQIEPVRKSVTRSKRSERGMVSDTEHENGLDAEGINEFWALRLIVAIGRFDFCKVQPFVMFYSQDGTRKKYYPDFLLGRGEKRLVGEVKVDWVANRESEKRRFALISELLAEHGFQFLLWRKSEVLKEPRYTSACLLLRYRRAWVPEAERKRILALVSSVPHVSIAEVSQRARVPVPSICSMVLKGSLHIDWSSPLTIDSSVSLVPIGPQMWPSPFAQLPLESGNEKESEEKPDAFQPLLDEEAIRIVREAVAGIQNSRQWGRPRNWRRARAR